MSAGDTSEVMLNGKLVKPLSKLSVHEVGIVLDALKLGKYKETFLSNEIDGECLMKCNSVEDVKEMGILMTVKAHVFLDKVMTWKAMIHNDHEGSVVDDTSIIEPVVKDDVTDEK